MTTLLTADEARERRTAELVARYAERRECDRREQDAPYNGPERRRADRREDAPCSP